MMTKGDIARPSQSAPALGLVCVTASEEIRYRTITRKRVLTLSDSDRQQVLHELYQSNIETLRRALHFCHAQRLTLYRLSSSLFPFSDEPYGARVLDTFHQPFGDLGRLARTFAIRLVMHPDQYVVLSSDSDSVIGNSIKILTAQARVLDALDQPRSPWAALQLHGGKASRARKLIEVTRTLDDSIRRRLALENDEYAFSAQEILDICSEAGLPMVFDAHHHLVHEQLDTYEHPSMHHYVKAAARTWPKAEWQLVHISNGCTALGDPSHSDFPILKLKRRLRRKRSHEFVGSGSARMKPARPDHRMVTLPALKSHNRWTSRGRMINPFKERPQMIFSGAFLNAPNPDIIRPG